MDSVKDIKDKIKKIEKRISLDKNPCCIVHLENLKSLESDKQYLEILKNKLKNISEKNDNKKCSKCGNYIEMIRISVLLETNLCSHCKD